MTTEQNRRQDRQGIGEQKEQRGSGLGKQSRRKLLKNVGVGSAGVLGLSGIGAASSTKKQEVSLQSCHAETFHGPAATDTNGNVVGEITTTIATYPAEVKEEADTFWTIDQELSTNAATYLSDDEGLWQNIQGGGDVITWDENKYQEKVFWSDVSQRYVSDWSYYETNTKNNNDWFLEALEEGLPVLVSLLPGGIKARAAYYIAGRAWQYAIDNMLDNQGQGEFGVEYDWTSSSNIYGTRQVNYNYHWWLELGGGDSIKLTHDDSIYGTGINASNYVEQTIEAPNYDPASTNLQAVSQDSSTEVVAVSGEEIASNPQKYGYTKAELQELSPDDVHYFAPVKVESKVLSEPPNQ